MIHERDFYKLLGGFIAGEVSKQLAPLREALGEVRKEIVAVDARANRDLGLKALSERIENVEKALGDMPVPTNGKDGRDGIDGKDGAPGKDGENVEMESVWEEIDKAVDERVTEKLAAWPKPKDGINGTDGADGKSVGLDDIRDCLAELVREAVGELPVPRHCVNGFIDRDGALALSFSDGTIVSLGKVVGEDGQDCDMEKVARLVEQLVAKIEKPKDGIDGKDGRDGLGFKDMSVTFDGERGFIFKFVLEDRVEELSLVVPFMIYRGVWKQGGYERGDVVTRDGSTFVALADTLTIPGTKDCEWQLCCKRGSPGKEGERGPQGPAGAAGEALPQSLAAWPVKGA